MIPAHRHDLRHDTAADWTAANPVLAAGEPGFETDTKKVKFGDGSTAWNSLAYWSSGVTEPFFTATAQKSANYTAGINEFVPFDTTAAARTLTLPNAPADGTKVGARIAAGTNTVTVNRAGSDTIGAATSLTLSFASETVVLKYRASDHVWVIIDHGYTSTTFVPSTRLITNGYGVTGWGDLSADRTPAVSLSTVVGHLASDVTSTPAGTLVTVLTTGSLAAGKWLLTVGATYTSGASGGNIEHGVVVGTATATFDGQQSGAVRANTGGIECGGTLQMIVTVTGAGTLVFQARSVATDFTAKASTTGYTFGDATGYTAVRLA